MKLFLWLCFYFNFIMLRKNTYTRGRHFKFQPNVVIEVLFADQSDEEVDNLDEEVDNLDEEDIEVLGEALDKQRESVIISTSGDERTLSSMRDYSQAGCSYDVPTLSSLCSKSSTGSSSVVTSSTPVRRNARRVHQFPLVVKLSAFSKSSDIVTAPSDDEDEGVDASVRKKNEGSQIPDFEVVPRPDFNWIKKCCAPVKPKVNNALADHGKVIVPNGSPFEVYSSTCDVESLVNIIVAESNIYAEQSGIEFKTNSDEINAFLGLLALMGYHKLPSTRNYWSTSSDLGVSFVQNVMPVKRFDLIKRCLHFNNNEMAKPREHPEYDRAFKIRPVLDHLNSAFQAARIPEQSQSVDERMIKFKGHNIMRQYIKSKPVKWGFKMWMRCGSKSGYTYQAEMYTGKKCGNNVEVGLGENVVLHLTKSLIGSGCKIFMDNFFTSPYLLHVLHQHGLEGTGTVRSNRKGLPVAKPDNKMVKGEVQSFQTSDRKLNFLKWLDTKAVFLVSNAENSNTKIQTERRQKGNKDKLDVNIPSMVRIYNQNMGGVDLADQLKTYYAIDIRSRHKYYLRVVFDLMDTAVVNGYVNFKALNEDSKMTHLEFRQNVVHGLIGKYTSRKNIFPSGGIKRKAAPLASLHVDHMPHVTKTRKRCKLCYVKTGIQYKSYVKCDDCGEHLCLLSGRNCFAEFHQN